ncbi:MULTISPECIES: allantoate deiminase [Bacillaceae]|uniref:allantoate deiminase n=1 Tax=Bacillaceae TaxID=186817 RepID=UPI00288BCC9A|nr:MULTISPECIES: allantoate deiminase [Bacillaceae]
MMKTSIQVNEQEIDSWLQWLSEYGQTEDGGVTRLLYDENWAKAQGALKIRMEQIGLSAQFDGVGNLFGKLEGTDESAKSILTGSHIDTVVNGGKYDGGYGIIASCLAVNYLAGKYGKPLKTIEVVSLCEEEGSRFPLAFWGSGSITGRYQKDESLTLFDTADISMAQALNKIPFIPESDSLKRTDIGCFIELHIEQGAVLEKEEKSIGVVSHIVGQRRFTIKITGESNHAGTTPMMYRKDSLHIASQLILHAMDRASAVDSLVATVGSITASPNVPNVIPKEVVFTLDVRHHEEEAIQQYCESLFAFFHEKCDEKGLQIEIDQWLDVKPVAMNSELQLQAEEVLQDTGLPYKTMTSGAGHDAQVFGPYCPTALLFVPSTNGISHSPDEFTNLQDLKNGVTVLIELLHKLAY